MSSPSGPSGVMCLFAQLRKENPSLRLSELRNMVVDAWKAADYETRKHYVRQMGTPSLPPPPPRPVSGMPRIPWERRPVAKDSSVSSKRWSDYDFSSTPKELTDTDPRKKRALRFMLDQFEEISPEEARRLRVPPHVVDEVNSSVKRRKASIEAALRT